MSDALQLSHWAGKVPTSTRGPAMLGYVAIAAFIGFFGYWGATAPLAGAAIAPGVVAAAGQNMIIQHLEGGTVLAVNVKEGDKVERGQALVTLDPTVPKAQLDRLLKNDVTLRARSVRLQAERDAARTVVFSPDILKLATDTGLESVIEEQKGEFAARLARHENELEILNQRASQLLESVNGLEARKAASDEQLKIVKGETARKLKLLDKGLTARDQYTQLLRSQADLLGQVASAEAQLAAAKNQITEAKEQIERAKSQRIEDALKELSTMRSQISDGEEQIKAARSVLERTNINSPTDGVIVSLGVNGKGIVLRPGDRVLEILPTTSDLIVEANVSPTDVDVIHVGQEARLRFVALNNRTTPEVSATITYISADRRVDQSTQQSFYTARLRITENLPPEISLEQIYPGMPVETYFSTGDRTFAEYLVKPVIDSFSRSFRED